MNAAFQEGVFVRTWEGEGSCEGLGKGGLNLGQPCLNLRAPHLPSRGDLHVPSPGFYIRCL